MATVNIYNKTGELIETHKITGTLLDWIIATCPDYNAEHPVYSASINGFEWPHSGHSRQLIDSDVISVVIEPEEPATWAMVIIAVLSAAYSYYTMQNLPQGYEDTTAPGQSIYSANARINRAVPSGIIREWAGQLNIFPDVIVRPHILYEDNFEFKYILLSAGRGYYDLATRNIYVSQTQALTYQEDISIEVFEPGSDLSGNIAHQSWYESKEVSNLRLTTRQDDIFGDWTADFSGDEITAYLDGVATTFPFIVGEIMQVQLGTNAGFYKVDSLSGASNETAAMIEMTPVEYELDQIDNLLNYQDNGVPVSELTQDQYTEGSAASFTTESGVTMTWASIAGGVNWEGPFILIPEDEVSGSAEIDIRYPRGLIEVNSSNEKVTRISDVYIQWRESGTLEWTQVDFQHSAATYDEQGETVTISFGSDIRPEMRFRRVTAESTSTGITDVTEVRRVKCRLTAPTSYSDITTIAIRMRGSATLAKTAENRINIRDASRKLPTLQEIQDAANGTPFDLSASNTAVDASYNIDYAEELDSSDFSGEVYAPIDAILDGGFDLSADGLHLTVMRGGRVKIFTLASAYATNNVQSYDGYFNVDGISNFLYAVQFGDSGNSVYTLAKFADPGTTKYINQHVLGDPYDPTEKPATAVTLTLPGALDDAVDFYLNIDGVTLWVASDDNIIRQFTLSTAWDISTATIDAATLDVTSMMGVNTLKRIHFAEHSASDPVRLFISDNHLRIATLTMSTPGDITTASDAGHDLLAVSSDDLYVSEGALHLLKGQTEKGSAVYSSYIRRYSMPEYADTRASRSIIRFVANAFYDAAGSDVLDMIDWTVADALDTLLEGRGDYLDAEFVDETTLWEAAKIMLAPGYCEPSIKKGVFSPVRIATGTDYVHSYTPDIMQDEGLQVDNMHYDMQEPDGIDVEYFSSVTNEMEIVECRVSGDLGISPKRIQAIGITDETKAWRFGMRERNRLRHKPATFSFTTEMDALNSSYGDAIAVASELFGSQCGEVAAYSAPTVTLDFDPVFGVGDHFMALRNREGEFSGLYAVVAGGSPNEITLISPATLDFVPVLDGAMDSTFITFGNSSEWGKRAIVRDITPSGDTIVDITAEEYVAEVYADDDNAPS